MTTHTLKTWDEYFEAIQSRLKTFEVRKDDRNFKVGDQLILVKTNKKGKPLLHQNNDIVLRVTYVLRGEEFGIKEGYCVMGFDSFIYAAFYFRDYKRNL